MRQFLAARFLAASVSVICLCFLVACGGTPTAPSPVASIVINPTSLSMNQGGVRALSAQALNSSGSVVAADIAFTSSNTSLATVTSAGIVCGGAFDSNGIVCSPAKTSGQATIPATSGSVTATATVYVHQQVDQVVLNPVSGCSTLGTLFSPSATVYNTSASGCSKASPCDITSTVGPITYGSVDNTVIATAAGINPTFSSVTQSPTYTSGGTISGSKGQTCNLTEFTVGGSLGINPIFSASTNSPTYTSGGTISGTAGQTCTLSDFNNVSGATATVVLTGQNAISSGTHLTIVQPGSGGTTAPTTATLSNGTATCSGTANVITALSNTGVSSIVTGALGTVTLTGSNTIASGTQLTITNPGFGAVAPPTTATLSNGTATCSGTANVITALNTATGLRATNPGQTSMYASVAGVNSVGVSATVCPVASIDVHDASGSGTNFTIQAGATQDLVADVFDTMGNAIMPTLTWSTIPSAAANGTTVSSSNAGSFTGVSPGTVSVTATCGTPICNTNLAPAYSSNVATITIGGGNSTQVFAASSQSLTMVPIPNTTNTPATGVTLPALPNSILPNPAGTKIYLGSASGVMIYDVGSASVTTLTINNNAIKGTVLAVSPDGNNLLVADSDLNQTYYINISSTSISFGHALVATSGAFTPDSNWLLFVAGQQLLRDGVNLSPATTNLPYQANNIGLLAQGSLAFITSSSAHSIDVRSTCNQGELQTLSANSPTSIQGLPNGKGAVAVDPPGLDVITTSNVSGYCPVAAQNTVNTYDFGAGGFTPKQLFLSSDSSRAWVISSLPDLLSFDLKALAPVVIPLANGAIPYSGGITMDGSQVYVGASDNKVHLIPVSSLSDTQQIAPGLKDANGNVVPPDLVTVLPH